MELREVQAPECDVESVLNFAQYVMLNAARSLTEFGSEQRRRFWQLLFAQGIRFSKGEFETAIASTF